MPLFFCCMSKKASFLINGLIHNYIHVSADILENKYKISLDLYCSKMNETKVLFCATIYFSNNLLDYIFKQIAVPNLKEIKMLVVCHDIVVAFNLHYPEY